MLNNYNVLGGHTIFNSVEADRPITSMSSCKVVVVEHASIVADRLITCMYSCNVVVVEHANILVCRALNDRSQKLHYLTLG